jgi:addiction module HigA family antidote
MKKLANVHPSEIPIEEFLQPMGISQQQNFPSHRCAPAALNDIVHGKRAITADTVLRLAKYFGTSESFWMGLQADCDLEEVRKGLGKPLECIGHHAP